MLEYLACMGNKRFRPAAGLQSNWSAGQGPPDVGYGFGKKWLLCLVWSAVS
jgi:hypothetical protein